MTVEKRPPKQASLDQQDEPMLVLMTTPYRPDSLSNLLSEVPDFEQLIAQTDPGLLQEALYGASLDRFVSNGTAEIRDIQLKSVKDRFDSQRSELVQGLEDDESLLEELRLLDKKIGEEQQHIRAEHADAIEAEDPRIGGLLSQLYRKRYELARSRIVGIIMGATALSGVGGYLIADTINDRVVENFSEESKNTISSLLTSVGVISGGLGSSSVIFSGIGNIEGRLAHQAAKRKNRK